MTTATAFGSLWLSKFPGMSSMGKLGLVFGVDPGRGGFVSAGRGPPRKVVPEEGA